MSQTTEPAEAAQARRSGAGDAGFALFLALAVAAAAFLVAGMRTRAPRDEPWMGMSTPAVRPAPSFPADVPRPLGSEAHDAERDRIVAALRALGYEPDVETSWSFSPMHRTAAQVQNVVAARPGATPGPTVHVVAHYDSVPAGPGASDDGNGVAILLEVARRFRDLPVVPVRGVTFLFTDGEEGGLHGARAYLERHGRDAIAAVVNIEARGTDGPALMFETGPQSAWTVGAWAPAAVQPITGSLFASVYRTLPNHTDLTVFGGAGIPGLNFACIGGVQRYHTALDARGHADEATFAHLRENVWAAAERLASAPAGTDDTVSGGEAHWCDVLAFGVLHWPAERTPALAWIAAGLIVVAGIAGVVRRRLTLFGWLGGAGVAALSLAGAVAAVWGTGLALQALGALPRQFVATDAGALAAAAGAALVGGAVPAWLAARRLSSGDLGAGAWTFLAAAGVWLATTDGAARDGAYLLVLPALVVGAVSVLGLLLPRWGAPSASLVGVAALAVLWFPMTFLLADALGVGPILGVGLPLVAAGLPFAVVAVAVVPSLAGVRRAWLVPVAAMLVAVVGALVQVRAPTATPDLPQPLTIVYEQGEGSAHAHCAVWPAAWGVPEEMRAGREWQRGRAHVVPWRNDVVEETAAPALGLLAPQVADLRSRETDGGRLLSFRLVSRRGAAVTALSLAPSTRVRRIVVEGVTVIPETLRDEPGQPFALTLLTTPPEGVTIDLDVATTGPVEVEVSDTTWGLPPEVRALADSRPPRCVPFHWGDQTVARRRAKL